MAGSSLILHREAPEAIGAPGLSGSHPAEALLRCGLTVQGVNVAVNPLDDQGLYACGVEDIERQIDAALDASRAALASVRAMPGSQDRADAAVRLSRELRAVSDDASAVLHEEAVRIYYAENLSFGQVAKRLAISLGQAVRQYEEQHGEIKLPQPGQSGGAGPRLAT